MEYRSLGRTGVMVSPLCLGTMNFGGRTDEETSIAIINRAIEAGINIIDTADVYSGTKSEIAVGKALVENGKRDQIVLTTKVHGRVGDLRATTSLWRVKILCVVCRLTTLTFTNCIVPFWTFHRMRRCERSMIWCVRVK